MTPRALIVAGLLALAAALAVAALPRPETAQERVERIAAELRCPVCQGLSVADSPSGTARAMRAVVERRVAEGRTDDEIRAEFRRSYGDWIVLTPPLSDARALVWILPIAAVVAGGALAWSRVSRAPRSGATPPTAEQMRALRERELAEERSE